MSKITMHRHLLALLSALCFGTLLVACGGGQDPILGGDIAVLAPTVTAVAPANGTAGVPINIKIVTAAFSEAMAPITGTASFTLTCSSPCTSPAGAVALDSTGTAATFSLASGADLTANTVYTATVTGAESLATGIALSRPLRLALHHRSDGGQDQAHRRAHRA